MSLTNALRVVLIAAFLAGSAAFPSGAAADPGRADRSTPELLDGAVRRGEVSRARADLHLARALGPRWRQVPERFRGDAPWHGTVPLLLLRERVVRMEPGPLRAEIEEELAAGSCDGVSGGPSTHASTYFHIEHGTIGGGLTVGDYAASLDTAWVTQVNQFGWAAPPVHPTKAPPGGRYHVVVAGLGPGLYGFVSRVGTHAGFVGNNPATPWDEKDAQASCMAVNSNFSGIGTSPQAALDATTAHELNHSIQFGLGALTGLNRPDDSFIEGGATWMEDEVFDDANDSYLYLWPQFDRDMGEYGKPTGAGASPYPYWVTFRGLTERYGTGVPGAGEQVMQDFWEEMSKSTTSNMLTAMNAALQNKGTNLAQAFHAYAVAVKFNRACGGGYTYPHCLEEGPAYVAMKGSPPVHKTVSTVGGEATGTVRDNYALNWVRVPKDAGIYPLTLENTSTGGALRASAVCDTGATLRVEAFPAVAGPGAANGLEAFDSNGCLDAVVVVTNQSQTASNPTSFVARGYRVSATPPPAVAKELVLKASTTTIAKGKKVRLRPRVKPCAGHEGADVVLQKKRKNGGWRDLATKSLNDICRAKFVRKPKKTTTFRSLAPATGPFPELVSKRVRIKVT